MAKMDIDSLDFEKSGGLIPVIVQNAETGEVMTLAYCNREALNRTLKSGKSWFWSRSRQKYWMKGEESGNTQEVLKVLADCDADALIYSVKPAGPACHTGDRVCFHHEL